MSITPEIIIIEFHQSKEKWLMLGISKPSFPKRNIIFAGTQFSTSSGSWGGLGQLKIIQQNFL